MFYVGLKFFVYETLKGYLPQDSRNSLTAKLACGATTGVVGRLLHILSMLSAALKCRFNLRILVGAQ